MANTITISSDEEQEVNLSGTKKCKTANFLTEVKKLHDKEDCLILNETVKVSKIKSIKNGTKRKRTQGDDGLEVNSSKDCGHGSQVPVSSKGFEELVKEVENNFTSLLEYCKKLVNNEAKQKKLDNAISITTNLFKKIVKAKGNISEILKILNKKLENCKEKPKKAIEYLYEYYQELERHKVVTNENDSQTLLRLYKTLNKCKKRIRELEEQDVDWADEENSAYIKESRYKERAAQIYKEICKREKKNFNSINPLKQKLDFTKSKHPEINKALNNFCDNFTFPDYSQVLKCIKECAKETKLKLSDNEIKYEASTSFKHIGEVLKKRRQCDFKKSLFFAISEGADPADIDPELEEKLRDSSKRLEKDVNDITEKYVKLQECGGTANDDTESINSENESLSDSSTNDELEEKKNDNVIIIS